MKKRYLLTLALIALSFTAACGRRVDYDIPTDPPTYSPRTSIENRDKFAREFEILDKNGNAAKPTSPDGKSWVGAMIGFISSSKISFCSVSHVAFGKVLTAAHCFETGVPANDYYVIFYDRYGHKKFVKGQSFGFVGEKDNVDITMLNLNTSDDRDWDINVGTEKDLSPNGKTLPEAASSVTVWSLDPSAGYSFSYRHPNAMVFNPKKCMASKVVPTMIGVKESGREVTLDMAGDVLNSKRDVILDQCDSPILHGNSGSLVTLTENLEQRIGVMHAIVNTKLDSYSYSHYLYTGNSGSPITVYSYSEVFFYMATDLNYFLDSVGPGAL